MILTMPEPEQFDFFAVVVDGDYADRIVYVDDVDEEGFVAYELDENGKYDITKGYVMIDDHDLRVIPFLPWESK